MFSLNNILFEYKVYQDTTDTSYIQYNTFGRDTEISLRFVSICFPKHMFRLKNKKNNFQVRTLIWRPAATLYLASGKTMLALCACIKE